MPSNWNDTDPEDIRRGATIKALRQAYGLSVAEMAVAVGVGARYLNYIEAGSRSAPLELCAKIARRLDVALAAITVEDYAKLAASATAEDTAGSEPAEDTRDAA
jgi:transcriptional regulator with XRE-family HTH domain